MRVDVDAPLSAEWMSGRKALVTGGGGRDGGPGTVGWAIARTFARHGASVAVLDRDRSAAERTVSQIERAGGRAVIVLADVSVDEECARAVMEARDQLEGDCWDAAAAVLFLASDQARWVSGQVLAVDGGGPARQPYPGVTRAEKVS